MVKQQKVVFSVGGKSPIHILQGVSLAFCIAGCFLGVKLLTGPHEALISDNSKIAWAAVLVSCALAAPVMSWYYGRKIVSRIAISDDGKAWIKDANLIGSTDAAWSLDSLQVTGFTSGDPAGEQSGSPPRVTLVASEGDTQRSYVVPVRGKQQVTALRDALTR